ncbi:hypothetical protein, partial [Sutterella wadsworthensis]|uniref:hypothetical protein n=1 Tax=Sutterella wadsworthensis TaxID=40545 RepID=UPI003A8EAE51
MSHLFTNLRCIPLSVLLAFIGGVLLVGSSGMETLKNFAYRPYIADILAVLKIVGSTAAALSLVLYLIRRTRALNYGLPALHFESPRWFRKLEQFKTAPTRGRNTVPDPSVGVVSFMSP